MDVPLSYSKRADVHHFSEVVKAHFDEFDADKSGTISKKELRTFLSSHDDQSEAALCAHKLLAEYDGLSGLGGLNFSRSPIFGRQSHDDAPGDSSSFKFSKQDLEKLDSFSSADAYKREHRNLLILNTLLGAATGAALVYKFSDLLPAKYRKATYGIATVVGAVGGYLIEDKLYEKQSYEKVTNLATANFFELKPEPGPSYLPQAQLAARQPEQTASYPQGEARSYLATYYLDLENKRKLEEAGSVPSYSFLTGGKPT